MTSDKTQFFSDQVNPEPAAFLDQIDFIRTNFQDSLDKVRQAEMGQFSTRPSIASMMAGMFTRFPKDIDLVDLGAGVGSLSAAFITVAIQAFPRPRSIHIIAYDLAALRGLGYIAGVGCGVQ